MYLLISNILIESQVYVIITIKFDQKNFKHYHSSQSPGESVNLFSLLTFSRKHKCTTVFAHDITLSFKTQESILMERGC